MRNIIITCLVICVLICFSCITPSQLRHTETDATSKKEAPTEAYHSIHYKGTATVTYHSQTQRCQYNLVSVVDSFLYVQLSIAGLELGRALLTNDKILVVNKIDRSYFQGDYSISQELLGIEVDYKTLQAIFMGEPTALPPGVDLYYQTDSDSYNYPFFSLLIGNYLTHALQLDVKKATFNLIPEVNINIPKNYERMSGVR